jgi:hypothetical protein
MIFKKTKQTSGKNMGMEVFTSTEDVSERWRALPGCLTMRLILSESEYPLSSEKTNRVSSCSRSRRMKSLKRKSSVYIQ